MRKPIEVLNSLKFHAKNEEYKYMRLYRNFYNPEFYLQAYANIQASQGNMTKGVDGFTIDGMSEKRIEILISKMKDFSYKPNPARRIYIPKRNGKTRPLGIPSFEDKLVQEVTRMILESIYESGFSKYSHGFRPNRSCHTALQQIKQKFQATKWFIEGDIVSFFDNINHQALINILKEKIVDEEFIILIWKFLKAGYIEIKTFHKTYSGTAQGNIISPILSNVYLDKLDKYMEQYMNQFHKGKTRKLNKEYIHYHDQYRWLKNQKYSEKEWKELSNTQKSVVIKEVHNLKEKWNHLSSVDHMDSEFRRLSYVRYADDFVCGVVGSKKEAEDIKSSISSYLKEQLHLELSDEKTKITHGYQKARFLGYDICVNRSNDSKRKRNGNTFRCFHGNIKLFLPTQKWQEKLIDFGALRIKYMNHKEVFEPIHRNCMVNNDDLEILNQFNSEIRGIYNYYQMADNASVLNDFYYVMSYSMFKTYAAKYKTHISVIRKKYGVQNFAIPYRNKAGEDCKAYFYNGGFKVNRNIIKENTVDLQPNSMENLNANSLLTRLKSNQCEICGATGVAVEVHHVRKLKDLKGKARWEKIMIGRKRKTLILCTDCHDKIHAGKLD